MANPYLSQTILTDTTTAIPTSNVRTIDTESIMPWSSDGGLSAHVVVHNPLDDIQASILANKQASGYLLDTRTNRQKDLEMAIRDSRTGVSIPGLGAYTEMTAPDMPKLVDNNTYSGLLPFEMVVTAKKIDKPMMYGKVTEVKNVKDFHNAWLMARAAGADTYRVIENGKEKEYSTLDKGESTATHKARMLARREYLLSHPEVAALLESLYNVSLKTGDFGGTGDATRQHHYGTGRGNSWGNFPKSKKKVIYDDRLTEKKGASKGSVLNGKTKKFNSNNYKSKATAKHLNGGKLLLILRNNK